MRIAIGSDHRGFHLKEQLIQMLRSKGHDVDDEGTCGPDSVDYPDFAALVAKKISQRSADRGILICGTGIGMAIAANKFPGVRAAPCNDEVTAEMSRRHNDLNVLCLSADMLSPRTVERMVEVWLGTPFEGGRHERRVEKIHELEQTIDGK
jgi:ribose 5-phosphate isomerase B